MTRSFEMVIASARLSSTTMPVAAERPADHGQERHAARAGRERKREHRQITIDRAVGEHLEARRRRAARRTG